MRLRTAAAAAGIGLLLLPYAVTRGDAPADPPRTRCRLWKPPIRCPRCRSARRATRTTRSRPGSIRRRHTIEGRWCWSGGTRAGVPAVAFPFHLYWNAFRNNLSTSARGRGPARARAAPRRTRRAAFGLHAGAVRSAGRATAAETDLTPTLRYVQPDDAQRRRPDGHGGRDARPRCRPAPPPASRSTGTSRIPYGDVGRAGWVHDYHFIVQWFPKIGVLLEGRLERAPVPPLDGVLLRLRRLRRRA